MKRANKLEDIVDAGWAPSVLYLQRRLRRKEIGGYKVGRTWVMTDADLDAYLESVRNAPPAVEEVQDIPRIGLSSASARRRSA